jgi:hypothetical protein
MALSHNEKMLPIFCREATGNWFQEGKASCSSPTLNTSLFPYGKFPTYAFSRNTVLEPRDFTKFKRTELRTFLKRAPKFSLREWKSSETEVAKEYCWAITRVAKRSYCDRWVSSDLYSGFQADSHIYVHDHVYIEFRRAQNSTCAQLSGL